MKLPLRQDERWPVTIQDATGIQIAACPDAETAAELVAAVNENQTLRNLLQRACDDQREIETRQGMIEWYPEAMAILSPAPTERG